MKTQSGPDRAPCLLCHPSPLELGHYCAGAGRGSRVCQVRASRPDSCHCRSGWRCSRRPSGGLQRFDGRRGRYSQHAAQTRQRWHPTGVTAAHGVASSPWQPVIDPLRCLREGGGGKLMMGKKQRQRMESNGVVGEQRLRLMYRGQDERNVCSAASETDVKALHSPPNVPATIIVTNVLLY